MKIAILEDNADRCREMKRWLADRFYPYECHFFDEPTAMAKFLEDHLSETILISLDHDLDMKQGNDGRLKDPGTGRDVVAFLRGRAPVCQVILHTSNAHAASAMEADLRDAGWKTKRIVPMDDLAWIGTSWFPAIRRAILDTAVEVAAHRS